MGTLAITRPTLHDVVQRLDPDGSIARIVRIRAEQNAILDRITWQEANGLSTHKYTLNTAEPAGSWRAANEGTDPSKSAQSQYTDVTGQLTAYNDVDRTVAEQGGNKDAFRLSETRATIDGMTKNFAGRLIYGDVLTAPKEFTGIIPRYSSLSGTTGGNIIDAGGTGSDNTSILLVGHGPDSVFGIYPKGSKGGLIYENKGLLRLFDKNNKPFEGYSSYFEWNCGLCVKNWKYIARVANIDVSKLLTAGTAADTSAAIMSMMVRAVYLMPELTSISPVFYMNKTVMSMMAVKILDKSNNFFTTETLTGAAGIPRPNTLAFMGIPCLQVDQMLNTESRVT
jgi:hypothetical protein